MNNINETNLRVFLGQVPSLRRAVASGYISPWDKKNLKEDIDNYKKLLEVTESIEYNTEEYRRGEKVLELVYG